VPWSVLYSQRTHENGDDPLGRHIHTHRRASADSAGPAPFLKQPHRHRHRTARHPARPSLPPLSFPLLSASQHQRPIHLGGDARSDASEARARVCSIQTPRPPRGACCYPRSCPPSSSSWGWGYCTCLLGGRVTVSAALEFRVGECGVWRPAWVPIQLLMSPGFLASC
jgi:hypothetical protein